MFKMPIDNLFRARGVWLRVLVVWALACTFPFFDEVKQYDLRFGIRGKQETAKFVKEPERSELSQPPAGYQTPSPNYAYGAGPMESKTKTEYNPIFDKGGN